MELVPFPDASDPADAEYWANVLCMLKSSIQEVFFDPGLAGARAAFFAVAHAGPEAYPGHRRAAALFFSEATRAGYFRPTWTPESRRRALGRLYRSRLIEDAARRVPRSRSYRGPLGRRWYRLAKKWLETTPALGVLLALPYAGVSHFEAAAREHRLWHLVPRKMGRLAQWVRRLAYAWPLVGRGFERRFGEPPPAAFVLLAKLAQEGGPVDPRPPRPGPDDPPVVPRQALRADPASPIAPAAQKHPPPGAVGPQASEVRKEAGRP